MREPLAKECLELNKIWNNTDKVVVLENVKKYMQENIPECQHGFNVIWDNLVKITGAKRHTVYAWLNRGRSNVKIPLIRLCEIADKLGVDIMKFFDNK